MKGYCHPIREPDLRARGVVPQEVLDARLRGNSLKPKPKESGSGEAVNQVMIPRIKEVEITPAKASNTPYSRKPRIERSCVRNPA